MSISCRLPIFQLYFFPSFFWGGCSGLYFLCSFFGILRGVLSTERAPGRHRRLGGGGLLSTERAFSQFLPWSPCRRQGGRGWRAPRLRGDSNMKEHGVLFPYSPPTFFLLFLYFSSYFFPTFLLLFPYFFFGV